MKLRTWKRVDNTRIDTWWERLLKFLGLLRVKHTKCVKVLGAPNLELHHILASLDFHRTCILPSRSKKEVLDLMNLLRLKIATCKYLTWVHERYENWKLKHRLVH